MAKSDNGELNQSDLQSDSSDPNNNMKRGTKRLRNILSMVIWDRIDEEDYGNGKVQRISSSIFKKVTKRVSGLFPSSLTKWFGPSGEGQSVIRRRESVEEDDEALQIHQPPKKRVRPNELDGFSTLTSTPLAGFGSRDLHLQTPGPSGFKRHFPEATAAPTTVSNGDDKSDSGDSTSGYSSVLAQQHKEPSFVSDRGALNQPGTSKSSTCPSKTLNTSLNSTRSLFSSESLNPKRPCLSSRRPSFSTSTFGSPSFIDRTLSTKRAVNSPFYSGRTTFGGASAYRRNRFLFTKDESSNLQVKNSVSMKPTPSTSSASENASLSKTARRILETLEHFSSPVLDARKIPNINRQNCDLTKTRNAPYARGVNPSNKRELLIPSVPDLLKMKQKERLQDSTVQVRNLAVNNSKSVLNTEYSLPALVKNTEESAPKHTNKMKSKVISSVREKKTQIEVEDTVDAVVLPDIPLPITNLPKFDFTVTPPSSSLPVIQEIVTTKTPLMFTSNVLTILKSPTKSTLEYNYNFSKPLVLVSDIPKSVASINNFKFSDPIDAKAKKAVLAFKTSTVGNTAPRKRDSAKNNGQQVLQPANKLVEGSVMDVLGKKIATEAEKTDKKPWECSNCLVRNMYCDSRCSACQTVRENTLKQKPEQPALPAFGNEFKKPVDKWECSVCLVRNNNSDNKCVACTSPKPGSLIIPPVSAASSSLTGWGDKFKTPAGSWDCSTCMIQNKSRDVKCVACETPKPGSVTATGNKTLIVPSGKSGGFGDLMKKQQSNWECSSCMVRNPPEKKSCMCCEAPKPGETQQIVLTKPPAASQFKFGLDKVSTEKETPASNGGFKFGAAAGQVEKTPVTFSFGIPAASKPATTNSGFSFGTVATTTEAKLLTTTTTTAAAASTTFAFGTPSIASKPTNSTFNFGVVTSTSTTITKQLLFGTTDKVDSTPSAPVSSTTATSVSSVAAAKPAVAIPQFNFSVPFTPKAEDKQNSSVKPIAKPLTEALPSFGAFKSTFSFTPAPTKSFSFTPNSDAAKPSSSGFAFAPEKPAEQPTLLSKAPVFNFASGNTAEPANNLFSFGAPSKTVAEVPKPTGTFGASQNGGFNFGAAVSKPSFNFGASPAVNTPSSVFGFGASQSQAGTGSLPAVSVGAVPAPTPAAPAAGVFTFGGPASSFTPDVKANSLFNTGSFTATSSSSSLPGQTHRKIRKAIRRTQPRMPGPWPSTD